MHNYAGADAFNILTTGGPCHKHMLLLSHAKQAPDFFVEKNNGPNLFPKGLSLAMFSSSERMQAHFFCSRWGTPVVHAHSLVRG